MATTLSRVPSRRNDPHSCRHLLSPPRILEYDSMRKISTSTYTVFPCSPNLTPSLSRDGERRTSRGSTNGSPAWGGVRSFPGPSPSMSSVRPQYDRTPTANVLDSPLSHSTEETHSPTASLLLLASDQPLPARNSPFVPRRPERTGRGAPSVTAPPLPPQSHRTPENWSTLHPELAAIRWNESSLSKKGDQPSIHHVAWHL